MIKVAFGIKGGAARESADKMTESADLEWIRSAYGDLPFPELDAELARLGVRPVTLSHLPQVTVACSSASDWSAAAHSAFQLRRALLARAEGHELGVCSCDCCVYVLSLLQSVAALQHVSSVQLTELRSIGGLSKGTVCKEDTFRGLVRFSVQYAFAADELLEPDEARKKLSALAAKILECFDGTMVRCGGTGWRSKGPEEKVYRISWTCRANEVNKSAAGKRKEGGWYIPVKDRVVAGGERDPCCTNVSKSCSTHTHIPTRLVLLTVVDSRQAFMQITADTPRNLTSGKIEVKIAQLHGHSTSPGLMGERILP